MSKFLLGLFCVILVIITCLICYKLLFSSSFKTNDDMSRENEVFEITPQNYTNVLENVHKDIDQYVGQKIKFSGYVYRLYDFTEEQFVLARNMIISSDFQTVVVGFLCHSPLAQNYEDGTWIEVQGTITKGEYKDELAIIEVESINKIDIPSEEYVYPPDSSFITTSTVL